MINLKPTIYLSGPIAGTDWDKCTTWRDYVSKSLPDFNCLSPLRGKEILKKVKVIDVDLDQTMLGGLSSVMCSDQGIMTRDSWDTLNCDAIFINLLNTTRVSIGTMMELALAWEKRKIIVVVMEKIGNIHNHPMVKASTPYFVNDLDSGINLLNIIFNR